MGVKQNVVNYYDETIVELKKVSWPSKDEVRGSTVVVIITSIILSAFVFGIDRILSALVGLLMS